MASNQTSGIQGFGENISSGAKDLFAERAKWVQTWIVSRALPFTALVALVVSYYQISAGEIQVPPTIIKTIGVALLGVATARALFAVKDLQWSAIGANYQTSLYFLAGLLLFGPAGGDYPGYFWFLLLFGFWGAGVVYPKNRFMPGEFAAIALLLVSTTNTSAPPIADWIFVTLAFAPVMAWLQWKYRKLKPVLFMAALLLLYWIIADIEGWQIILAIIAALLLLCLAIYSVLQLKDNDASSFIQSVGLGVISGLLLFVFVFLGDMKLEAAMTWWVMFASFAAISAFIYHRNGRSLLPLLFLWCAHWAVITITATWEDWFVGDVFKELYGFHLALLCGAFALRYYACRKDINRLLVWSRVYMALGAFSLGFITFNSDDLTVFRLLFVLALFAAAMWFARPLHLAKGLPWWKGVVNPRHIVALRRILRKSGNFVASIPFVGPTVSAIIKGLQVIAKLKRNGDSINSGDLLAIAWAPLLAVFLSEYLQNYVLTDAFLQSLLVGGEGDNAGTSMMQWQDAIMAASLYVIAGILFAVINVLKREPLYPLLAMASFVLAPISIPEGEIALEAPFWLVCLISAVGILSVRELNRQMVQPA